MDFLKAVLVAIAIWLGIASLYLPPVPPRRPVILHPLCPAAMAEGKKDKPCSPACKGREVCVDGTCCQPASSATVMLWAADSLR